MNDMRRTSEFGCIRFQHSAFSRLATEVGNTGCMASDGTVGASAHWAADETGGFYIQTVMNDHEGQFPSEFVAPAQLLAQQVLLHALYVSAGRQVFQFTQGIINEFKLTDLNETPIGTLVLPYQAGFLHFGPQTDLLLDETGRVSEEYVDGAYFWCGPGGDLSVQLTLTRIDAPASGLPGPHFSIGAGDLELPAHEAVDKALDLAYKGTPRPEKAENDTIILEAMEEWDAVSRPVVHAALSLVLNALFYLDGYGADTGPVLPASIPSALRESYKKGIKKGTPKGIRNARKSLFSEGFTVVRLCGVAFDVQPGSGDGDAHAMSPHWRRGHWRMQPYGPKLSLVKRIRLRPVRVNAHLDVEAKGHIYTVEAPKLDSALALSPVKSR